MPLAELRNVSKRFPGVTALADVSLALQPGSIHALLGENGAGKSTLIHVLSGVLQPDEGEIRLAGRVVSLPDSHAARRAGIATVFQESDLVPHLSVAENLALEQGWPRRWGLIDYPTLRHQARQRLQQLGHEIDPRLPAANLTAAERQLVGIAAGMSPGIRVLVLDEPTSSLSEAEVRRLFEYLRRFQASGGAILYVSHRLEEIFHLADTVTVLRDGRRVWTGPLAATNAHQLVGSMVGREVQAAPRHRAAGLADEPGKALLACTQLTAADDSFREVSLKVHAGEILGIYGLIGAGRSQWAQALVGLRPLRSGQVKLRGQPWQPQSPGQAARAGIVYLPEDRLRQGLCGGLSVRANTVLAALRRISRGPLLLGRTENQVARDQTQALRVRLRSLAQPARSLSGGNQQKVILGRWLACQPDVLILDEPTRGVDIGAKAEIHGILRQLADSGRAVVLISSDLPEVLTHSDRVGVFREGQLVSVSAAGDLTAEQAAAAALPQSSESDALSSSKPAIAAREPRRRQVEWLREGGLLVAVLIVAALLSWRTNTFWQAATLRDLFENAGLLVLCGLGAALVILAGGIDISLGSIMALAAAIAGYLMQNHTHPLLATGAALAAAAACGASNAILTLLGRVHPIVVTLGTLSLFRGLTFLLIGSQDIVDVPASFRAPIQASPLGLPATTWLALFAVAFSWFLLTWTVPGRHTMALGSNPLAAARTGIHRWRVWLGVFTLQGFLAGIAGIVALALAGRVQSTDFDEKTLEAIGVAVVAGIAITGGRGSVWGLWASALLFRVLEKGWVLLHISGYWQRTIVGGLLLTAIVVDRLLRVAGNEES